MGFLRMLSRTVTLIDLPLGYTLTVWSSGSIALSHFGVPSLLDALLFPVGAVAAYLICAAVSYRQLGGTAAIRIRAIAVINVFSIVAAAVVSAVSRLFQTPSSGYLAAGFVGTLTYILCITALMYGAERISLHRQSRTRIR